MFRSCDRCEKPATVHLTEIKGGAKTERHLCEDCARSLHAPQPSQELLKLMKSFEPAQSLATSGATELARACPECGMTYAEFRQQGRFGCAKDYEVFGEDIEKLLKKIHGSARYTGKSPKGGTVEGGLRLDALARARKRLVDAIEAENYEEAARLRDEIRRLGETPLVSPSSPLTGPPTPPGGGARGASGS
ncbi:MAG TPA: UvrB/UvrC motif-containing protein [Planctomycetota bacterium]|nr:UvrB/UvrC motif-containing protein [Planctomycetota bacterium]